MSSSFEKFRHELRTQVADFYTHNGVAISNNFHLVACSRNQAVEAVEDYLGTFMLFHWIKDIYGWNVDDVTTVPQCWQVAFT